MPLQEATGVDGTKTPPLQEATPDNPPIQEATLPIQEATTGITYDGTPENTVPPTTNQDLTDSDTTIIHDPADYDTDRRK